MRSSEPSASDGIPDIRILLTNQDFNLNTDLYMIKDVIIYIYA
jgi:hypothetical protein